MTRRHLLAALAMCLLIAVPAPSYANGSHGLSASVRLAIKHSQHHYLRTICHYGLQIESWFRTRTAAGRRVIVAEVTCSGGTGDSPLDVGVYGRHGRERYLTDTGRGLRYDHRRVLPLSIGRYGAHGLVVHYGGYTRRDAVCCPSRLYIRKDRIRWSSYHRGALRTSQTP